jgi:hypothetical protein
MMPLLTGFRITVQRGTQDRFTDMTYVDHHQIDGCVEYPTGSTEEGLTNAHLTNQRELLVPYGSDILATDRILYHPQDPVTGLYPATIAANDPIRKTNTFNVVGDPKNWQNPFTGWQAGMQVSLERIK